MDGGSVEVDVLIYESMDGGSVEAIVDVLISVHGWWVC